MTFKSPHLILLIAGLKSASLGAGQHPQLWYNNHIPRPVWSYCLIIWVMQIKEAIGNGDNGQAVPSVCP